MKKNTSILNLQQNTSQHRFLAAIIINSTIDLTKFPFTVHLFILLCLILEEENILLLFRLHSTKTCVGRELVYVLYDIIWKRFFVYALLFVFVYLIFLRCYIYSTWYCFICGFCLFYDEYIICSSIYEHMKDISVYVLASMDEVLLEHSKYSSNGQEIRWQ